MNSQSQQQQQIEFELSVLGRTDRQGGIRVRVPEDFPNLAVPVKVSSIHTQHLLAQLFRLLPHSLKEPGRCRGFEAAEKRGA